MSNAKLQVAFVSATPLVNLGQSFGILQVFIHGLKMRMWFGRFHHIYWLYIFQLIKLSHCLASQTQ